MNPFESLSEDNADQIQKYLRFFAQKKEGLLRSINIEFSDAKADKLNEDMYSREEVEDFCDFLAVSVKNNVGQEIGTLINMGALAVSQLLESSQDKGVELVLETAAVENQALLQAVEKMGLESLPQRGTRRGIAALDTNKKSKEDSQRLKDKNRQLQDEVDSLMRRITQTERQLAAEKYESSASEGKSGDDRGDNDNQKIKKLENELKDSIEENTKRINDTTQFKQMRQLMQSQSGKIRDLKRRLERYEPDSVKEDDDDQY